MNKNKEFQKLKEFCKESAKDFNADLRFFQKSPKDGAIGRSWNSYGQEKIEIYAGNHSIDYILSVFFHELGHVWCRQNNIYPGYHALHQDWVIFAKSLIHHGLQAERYVDKVGKKISELYFPKGSFIWHSSYRTKEDIDWFYEEKEYWKIKLRERNIWI